ncbi:hypothetical protein [Mycobacterium sp. 3519A]|uniref:hypothetical protein n=1 Tax=Mycobacterium sp. 3519A TaxID=2057184 RepID=UPI000C7D905C|nr:hypothetical protein [Mycobacterium sp. 3519A]
MSETTPSAEPETGPLTTTPPAASPTVVAEPRRHGRLTAVAAWVGIVAGVVFIVAVIFFSGFFLGAHTGGGHRGWHHGGDRHHEFGLMHRGPMMFPMGPPRGDFDRPFPPGGPNFQGPQGPQQPGGPTTTAPRPS